MSGQPARITTDRLLLREFRPGDLEGYAAMCADPAVMRYSSPGGAVLSREDRINAPFRWPCVSENISNARLRYVACPTISTGSCAGRRPT